MAKLYKATIYILDVNECYNGIEEILNDAERGADDANFKIFDYQETEIEWDDDININCCNATKKDYDGYFE